MLEEMQIMYFWRTPLATAGGVHSKSTSMSLIPWTVTDKAVKLVTALGGGDAVSAEQR